MSREASTGQKLGLLGIALLLIALSVGSTLYVSGVPLEGFWGDDGTERDAGYGSITLTDAEHACRSEAKEVFGRRLTNLRVDRFSSRRDRADDRFKVYMEADIYPNGEREGVARDTYFNCFTATDAPDIEFFQYAEDGTQFIAPGEEGKGLFGL